MINELCKPGNIQACSTTECVKCPDYKLRNVFDDRADQCKELAEWMQMNGIPATAMWEYVRHLGIMADECRKARKQ